MYHYLFTFFRLGVFLLFLVASIPLIAQEESFKRDSLLSALESSQGSQKFDVLLELYLISSTSNYPEALEFAELAYSTAVTNKDSLQIIKGGRMRANVLMNMGRNDEAILVLNEVLLIAEKNALTKQVIYILNSIALAHTNRGNYDKALEFHFKSLILREKEGDQNSISISLNNIGLVYYRLKDFNKALDYYSRSLEVKKSVADTYDLDRLYSNIGLTLNLLKRHKEAIENFNQAFNVCNNKCSDETKKEVFNGLGVAYYSLSDFETAKDNILKSLEIAQSGGDFRYQSENYLYLGRIALESNDDINRAIDYLRKAQDYAEATDYAEELIDVYWTLSNVYSKVEDFKMAAQYQAKYIHLKDSIYNDNLIKNLAKVQVDYEERENLKTIESQGQTLIAKDEALTRQRLLNGAIAVIAILAASLVFVLYRSNAITKKVNKELSAAKTIIEAQNVELTKAKSGLEEEVDRQTQELKIANESLKRVNEELDNFIYKTSHDIRGPLASLKGICNVAIMDVNDPMALDYLKKLDETASHLNTILTRLLIINQINHASLLSEKVNFDEIVNDVILLEKKRGLPPRLKIEQNIQPDIQYSSDAALLRIILENLIDNAIKFYNDSVRVDPFVAIRISENEELINVSVMDNGIGVSDVDPEKIFHMFSRASERSGTGGIGLYLSKLATEKLGGTINFRTTEDKLTEFYAIFPKSNKA